MMEQGQVKWFNNEKGYGFITSSRTNEDIFVHFTGIHSDGFKTLKEGQHVIFELADGVRGVQATKVKVLLSEDDVE